MQADAAVSMRVYSALFSLHVCPPTPVFFAPHASAILLPFLSFTHLQEGVPDSLCNLGDTVCVEPQPKESNFTDTYTHKYVSALPLVPCACFVLSYAYLLFAWSST